MSMIETYRGESLAWEADDLGHMNMRFYIGRAGQARTFLLAQMGLPNTQKAKTMSTVVASRQHIKYHSEVRPGGGLFVRSGISEIRSHEMDIVHMIYRISSSGPVISATVTETARHIFRRTQKPFGWPGRVKKSAANFMCAIPEDAAFRNIDKTIQPGDISLKQAKALDLTSIGRGVFAPEECDLFGWVRPVDLIGRVSDSVQHLARAWPGIDFDGNNQLSGAFLEGLFFHRRDRPRAGDCYEICSGLMAANTHVRHICHWLLNPVTGRPWASMVGVACLFDLKARRLVKVPPAELPALQSKAINGLMP